MSDKKQYGGQAVIEGVMFGGYYSQVTAVRRQDGEIELFEVRKKDYPVLNFLKKIPFVRGVVALIEAGATGAKHLQFASEVYESGLNEEIDHKQKSKPSSGKLETFLGVTLVGVLSLLLGKAIFTALPAFLASILFDATIQNLIIQNLIEGLIKTLILLAYLGLISQTHLIKRLFQYHGAEHKVISAYENGEELTVKNVQKYSTLHYRCGSSFIIFSIIVGVMIYSFFSYDNVWDRIFLRLLLLPVVIGVSFEVLKATNAVRNIPFLKYLGYPGLWLQKLTTREPNDEQVEVAITAFKRLCELEEQAEAERLMTQTLSSTMKTG